MDCHIAESEGISVPEQYIRFKCFIVCRSQFFRPRKGQSAVRDLPVFRAEISFCTGKFLQSPGTAEMIEMPVTVKDPADITGIKAEFMDVLDQKISVFGNPVSMSNKPSSVSSR